MINFPSHLSLLKDEVLKTNLMILYIFKILYHLGIYAIFIVQIKFIYMCQVNVQVMKLGREGTRTAVIATFYPYHLIIESSLKLTKLFPR